MEPRTGRPTATSLQPSDDADPPHDGLQQVVVVARRRLGQELLDLRLRPDQSTRTTIDKRSDGWASSRRSRASVLTGFGTPWRRGSTRPRCHPSRRSGSWGTGLPHDGPALHRRQRGGSPSGSQCPLKVPPGQLSILEQLANPVANMTDLPSYPPRPASFQSGCRDLNPGPLDPQSSALTKLRHSP
jgi:hypothetical protein